MALLRVVPILLLLASPALAQTYGIGKAPTAAELAQKYGSKEKYLELYRGGIQKLVGQGFLDCPAGVRVGRAGQRKAVGGRVTADPLQLVRAIAPNGHIGGVRKITDEHLARIDFGHKRHAGQASS